jgi:hypothetical protein
MPIEEKLGAMDLTLPAPLVPPGTFELVKVHGGLAYIAGHGPFDGTTRLVHGLVGRDLTLDQAYDAARLTALCGGTRLSRTRKRLDRLVGFHEPGREPVIAPGATR